MIGILGHGRQGQKWADTLTRLKYDYWIDRRPHFDADQIIIATPAETHFMLARRSLLNGISIIIEKPMVMDVCEAEELLRIAREQQVSVFVNHTHLYSPAWRHIKAKAKDVKLLIGVTGGRDDNAKWEWGSHIAAMALDLGCAFQHCHLESPRKLEAFVVGSETIFYKDEPTNPLPMDVLLQEFMKADNDQSGLEMGMAVAAVLCV